VARNGFGLQLPTAKAARAASQAILPQLWLTQSYRAARDQSRLMPSAWSQSAFALVLTSTKAMARMTLSEWDFPWT